MGESPERWPSAIRIFWRPSPFLSGPGPPHPSALMRVPLLCWCLLCLVPLSAQGLEVDDTYEVERLVKDIFASGQCETITNVQRIGNNPESVAFFEGGGEGVGFDRGIILSTGRAVDAEGPNSGTTTGERFDPNLTSDPDLDGTSTGTVFDRAGIEFDFVPLSPIITFRYVFASEEYCEFVGAEFNDIFGFFVSGPGIRGPFSRRGVNIAQVPGTEESVSINNVNYRRNRRYFLDNEFPSVRQISGCGGSDEPGPRFQHIEYDGQTVILTATIELIPCRTYHLRLVVADVSDNKLDSAVFLEAGSFNLGGSVSLEREDGSDEPTTVFEGCTPTDFRVQRGADSDPRFPQTVAYRVGRNSQAREGSDFSAGSGTVTIPPGEDFAPISVTAFADGVDEGPESAWLYLDIPCACYSDSLELIISEPEPFEVGLEQAFFCPGEEVRLDAAASGGVEPYRYQWSFGSVDSVPTLPLPLPNDIQVTVTDACGQSATKQVPATPTTPPRLTSTPQDLRACRGDSLAVELGLRGQAPFVLTYTVNDGEEREYTFSEGGLQRWLLDEGGTYRLRSIRDQGCAAPLDTTFRADFIVPFVNPTATDPSCAGYADGSIVVDFLPTLPPYTLEYTGLVGEGPAFTDLNAGTYGVKITDSLGCTDEREVILRDPDAIVPPVIDCEALRRPPLRPRATGGVPPYEYSVDGVSYFQPEGFAGLEPGELYQLRVRDAAGCVVEAPDFFWPQANQRMALLPNFIPQELAGSAEVEVTYRVPPEQIAFYQWLPQEYFDCPTCPQTRVSAPGSGPISLVLEDVYGCRDSLVTQVTLDDRVPVYVPNAFSPDGDGTNDFVALFADARQVVRVLNFQVYSRWGALVWEGEDYAPNNAGRGWDGLIQQRPASVGTYVWTAEVLLTNGERQRQNGTVTLTR